MKKPGPLHIRIPPWIEHDLVRINGWSGFPHFSEDYLVIEQPEVGHSIALDFDLPVHDMVLTFRDFETRALL